MPPSRPPRRSHALPRWAIALALLTLPVPAAAQEAVQAMRDLIDRGYWHSAAQISGPALVAQRPDDPEAHLLYATALFLAGDVAEAAQRLAIATDLTSGGLPVAHAHLAALIRAEQGDVAGAARALQNVFLRQPTYTYAMDWGRLAWQARLLDDAVSAFEAAARTREGSGEAWPHLSLGRIHAARGQWDAAVAAYLVALDVFEAHDPGGTGPPSPVYVESWYRLGEAYEALGRLREAEAAYRAARSVDPNHGPSVQAVDRFARRGE